MREPDRKRQVLAGNGGSIADAMHVELSRIAIRHALDHIGDGVDLQPEEAAVLIERKARRGPIIATLRGGAEFLALFGDPLDRPPELSRCP